MSGPVNAVGASDASYLQSLQEWRDAFPGSVPVQKTVTQDGVVVESALEAYACGTDPETDAAVCSNGLAQPDALIVEMHDRASPAEVARRTGQSHGWRLETFTRWWNVTHYTNRGLPVPPPTPESQRQIANAFLQQQAADSQTVLKAWDTYDAAARVGNAIGLGTVGAATSFLPAGLFIDNPALLAQGLAAAEVAPMLTSSGGPDGGMGSLIGFMAGLAAPALDAPAAAPQGMRQLALRGTAALEGRAVAGGEQAIVRGEFQAARLSAGPAPASGPSVVVESRAVQVAPGREGRLQAIGLEPGQTRVVARASDGMGGDFEVVAGRNAAAGGMRAGEVNARPVADPVVPREPSVVVDPGAYRAPAVSYEPPGHPPRLVTALDNRAYYRSTGTSQSADAAGVAHPKQAGSFYQTLGAQEHAVPELQLHTGWLIKGEGLTSQTFMPPRVVMPGELVFEPQLRLETAADLNAWLATQGVAPVRDAAPRLLEAIGQLPPLR